MGCGLGRCYVRTNSYKNNDCDTSVIGCSGHHTCYTSVEFSSKTPVSLCFNVIKRCPTIKKGCSSECRANEGCNNIFGLYEQVEYSKFDTIKHKQQTVLNAITTLNPTIFSTINANELFTKTTEEQYKEYFRKLSESALTKSEQVLLIDQLSTDFVENNALNLFMNVQNIISKNNQPVDNKKIKEIIRQTMKNVLPNIITSYNYGEDFLKMNYANAYQTMYYATSLYLYKFKWRIIRHSYTIYINELPKEDNYIDRKEK